MKYRLIQLNPLVLYNKSKNGLPSILERGVNPPLTPNGFAYVEELPYPAETPDDGFMWVRELTAEVYGWTQTEAPIEDEIEPEWCEVPAWRVRAICAVIPLGDGLLIDAITALVEAIEDPVQKAVSKEVFFGGNTLKRNSNLLTAMAGSLGLTDEMMDDIFQQAYAIEV